MTNAELHTLLVNARAIQAERGHAKFVLKDQHDRVCMHGALICAFADTLNPFGPTYTDAMSGTITQAAVALGFSTAGFGFEAVTDMCDFNNQHGITLEDTLARFDEGIARLEAAMAEPELVPA